MNKVNILSSFIVLALFAPQLVAMQQVRTKLLQAAQKKFAPVQYSVGVATGVGGHYGYTCYAAAAITSEQERQHRLKMQQELHAAHELVEECEKLLVATDTARGELGRAAVKS